MVTAAYQPILVRQYSRASTWHVVRDLDVTVCGEQIVNVAEVWVGLRVTMCRRCRWMVEQRAKFGSKK